MSASTIFLVVVIKGALFAIAYKLGWLPDPLERAERAREEQLVLRAYREWRKNPGSRPPAEPASRSLTPRTDSLPRN